MHRMTYWTVEHLRVYSLIPVIPEHLGSDNFCKKAGQNSHDPIVWAT